MLLPVLQECFAPSRRKRDFDLRLSRLEEDLLEVRQQMQLLTTEVQRFTTLMSCDDKVSMRLLRANGVPQLAWQLHSVRSGLWQNGRHGPMQVLMPVEALNDDKRAAVRSALAFRQDDAFLRGFREQEAQRISLNLQAKVISSIANSVKSQVNFRGMTLNVDWLLQKAGGQE